MHMWLFLQCGRQHRGEQLPFARDRPQSVHQPTKDPLLCVVIAVADANPAGVTPDFGREKQKAQVGCRRVTCFRVATWACSSRWNSINQQFRL
jgi:hypothetical protein